MRRVLCALTIATGVGLIVSRVDACSFAGLADLIMQQQGVGEPPGPIGDVTYTAQRGVGPRKSGCSGHMGTSCDGTGSVSLHFKPATDPDSDAQSVGYRIRLVSGSLPQGLHIPDGPVHSDGDIALIFDDGAEDDQEPIDFSVTITPTDANGNEGPTSPVIRVTNAGRDASGCSVRKGRTGTVLVPLTILSLALLRRRFGRSFAG